MTTTMTKAKKTATLATARYEETKARHRLILAQTAESLAIELSSACFAAIPGVGLADDDAIDSAKVRHFDARQDAAAARKAAIEAVDALQDATDRRRDVEDAVVED